MAEAVSAQSEDVAFPFWRRNRLALPFATFSLTFGWAIANPFLPLILREEGVTGHLETWVGYLMAVYFALSFVLTPIWGVVADHYGRKPMVLRTSIGMGIIFFLLSVAPSTLWFVPIFLLLGTTNGFNPACAALAVTTTPPARMGNVLSMVQTGALLGSTMGPALGAVIAGFLPSYRSLYVASGVFSIAAGVTALILCKENFVRPQTPLRFNLVQDARLISRLPNVGVLLGVYLVYTLSFNGSVALVTVYTLDMLPDRGMGNAHLTNFWVGAVSMALPIGSALAVPVWGRLLDRFAGPRVLAASLLTGMLAVIPIVAAQSPLFLVCARFLFGAFAVGIGPAAITLVKHRSPPGMESRVLAYLTAFGMLGLGVGPFIAGQVGPLLGLRAYFVLNGLMLLTCLFAWYRSWFRSPRVAAHS
jgi:DHA1 family multidrug resistance protein-like MFS transporter